MWHTLTPEETAKKLNTNKKNGLADEDAKKRKFKDTNKRK